MAMQSQGADAPVRKFVAKLEAFAATLDDEEREMLRVALGIGVAGDGNDVRGYLSWLTPAEATDTSGATRV